MAYDQDPNNTGGGLVEVGRNLGYEYPLKLDWRPDGKRHKKVLQYAKELGREAHMAMSKRHPKFQEIDQTQTAFISDTDKINADVEEGKEINVIVPMSFAIKDTLLSHAITTLTGGPMFPITGVGPEDKIKAMLAELILDMHFKQASQILNIHTQLSDGYSYGMGVVGCRWEVEEGYKVKMLESLEVGEKKDRVLERGVVWEGNVLDNWNIYHYLPDPNYAAHEVQKFQFVGNIEQTDYNTLLKLEESQPQTYFNVRYLKKNVAHVSSLSMSGTHTDTDFKWSAGGNSAIASKRVDVMNMYATIIPKDLGLGKSPYPEKWLFSVAGDELIVRAHPCKLVHNKYPVTVVTPIYDGYSTSPTSLLEMVLPLQRAEDWFYRSHFHNVRQTLNNMFLIDPYLVNYSHVANPKPGKVICIREHVWGRGVQNAMEQLQTTDVTRSNMQDMAITMDAMQRVTGAVDQLQGVVRTGGERRSATEMRDTRMSALSRVSKQLMIMAAQGFMNLGRIQIGHLQQFMNEERMVALTGRHQAELRATYGQDYAVVTPEDIVGDFDVMVESPLSEGGEYVNEFLGIYDRIVANQETMMAFDSTKMMLHAARLTGSKNPTQFLRENVKFQLMPDDQALNEANDQNMISINEAAAKMPVDIQEAMYNGSGY